MGSGRTWDGDGLVHTINDARKSVCVSVMDFAPTSLFGRANRGLPSGHDGSTFPTNTPVWWPSLIDALLSAVLTRKVYVRLLVSRWAHTSGLIEPIVASLCSGRRRRPRGSIPHDGRPARDQAVRSSRAGTARAGVSARIPGHTRVNHTKYIVTDRRINIGTSNMTWDYFAVDRGEQLQRRSPRARPHAAGRVRSRLDVELRLATDVIVRPLSENARHLDPVAISLPVIILEALWPIR